MNILVVNAGSSSHKLSLYSLQNEVPKDALWKGSIDWSVNPPSMKISTRKTHLKENLNSDDRRQGIEQLLETLWKGPNKVIDSLSHIDRIGHRVVHGGLAFEKPVLITSEVKNQIRKLIPLAPLHNPANLEEIELFEKLFPSLIQIAVFDTTFHLSMAEKIRTYPLPRKWRDLAIQRYGFHGISHQYCAERIAILTKNTQLKIINCHLGNGCSLCAIEDGKSVATTMGFSPLEGLMMGTRSGSIDPEILLYLIKEQGCLPQEIHHALNFESGLKAIGGSSDMRTILSNESQEAKLAFEMFISRLKGCIGEMAAILGGFSILSFTGGIGENSSIVREAACKGLNFLNLELDETLNNSSSGDQDIAHAKSKGRIFVIHTEEEWMIAKSCYQMSQS